MRPPALRRAAALSGFCLLLLASLVLAACGESKEDKAMKSVCSARSDINNQINTLKNLPVSTSSISKAQDSLKAIGSDLSKIKDAQGDLKGDRKSQIQAANEKFTSQVKSIVDNVTSNLSLSNAKSQLTSA